METHQKDIEEKDPFGQNRRADEDDEKSFLKALLAERALKKVTKGADTNKGWLLLATLRYTYLGTSIPYYEMAILANQINKELATL